MSDLELGWAVGLFEGEGTIIIRQPRQGGVTHGFELSIASTDHDTLPKFQSIVGCGKVYGPYQYGNRKPYWKWNLNNTCKIETLLKQLMPMLGQRRSARAKEVLTIASSEKRNTYYTVSRKGMGGRPPLKGRA